MHADILTDEALGFLSELARRFRPQIRACLADRQLAQQAFVAGAWPDFLPDTASLREGDWQVAPIPESLRDRRVELTGAPQRKTLINGLNAPVSGFMADFEDALCPVWNRVLDGQRNLRDAIAGSIEQRDADTGKVYRLSSTAWTLHLRPRGWHQWEKHLYVDGEPVPAALFDFGLYVFLNAQALMAQGRHVNLYLPKMQSHLEARLWSQVFAFAAEALDLPADRIRATILIETLPAVFQMHEMLYELRAHASALNFGRWGYIGSAIKCLGLQPGWTSPDRRNLSLEQDFLANPARLLQRTAHQRGALAIGSMSPAIPVKNDPDADAQARQRVRSDKLIEAGMGYDGSWVAHPGLVKEAQEPFDAVPGGTEQAASRQATGAPITRQDLLLRPVGEVTEAGFRNNISIAIQYLEAWISGQACVPLYNSAEDAASVEICRTQIWHWLHADGLRLADGREVTGELFTEVLAEEMDNIAAEVGDAEFAGGRFQKAAGLFAELCLAPTCAEFLSVPAYELLD